MKRFLIIFLCLFTTDSFGSGIASNTNSAPCTNNTLETYSGNSNLSADWQPNEIQLRWYNNNTLMDVQSSANTCVYDGTLTIPQTAPTRTGYTFAGWQVRPEMDFATLNAEASGTGAWARCVNDGKDVCWDGIPVAVRTCTDMHKDLLQHEFKAVFAYGTVYGSAMCSETSGTWGQAGTPSNVYGVNCWCKVTAFKPNNENVLYAPLKTPKYIYDFNATSICSYRCAAGCVNMLSMGEYADFRRALFGID